jgi:hypothetical protein
MNAHRIASIPFSLRGMSLELLSLVLMLLAARPAGPALAQETAKEAAQAPPKEPPVNEMRKSIARSRWAWSF